MTRVKSKAVDLALFYPGAATMVPREDCWHIDDPRVLTEADVFIKQPHRGVFELIEEGACATEARLTSLEKIVRGQQVAVARGTSLEQRLKALEEKLHALNEQKDTAPVKRGPGRPKKTAEPVGV